MAMSLFDALNNSNINDIAFENMLKNATIEELNKRDKNYTILHKLAFQRHVKGDGVEKYVQLLIDRGVDVNIEDKYGRNALVIFINESLANKSLYESAEILMRNGARVEESIKTHTCILHIERKMMQEKIIKLEKEVSDLRKFIQVCKNSEGMKNASPDVLQLISKNL